jgi:putative transposase
MGRVVLPFYPHYIVQRGHNRQVVFAVDSTRKEKYKRFLRAAIPPGEWELIRSAVQRGHLTGGTRFSDQIEEIVGRRIELR